MKSNENKKLDNKNGTRDGLGHGERLSRKAQDAVLALLTHPTIPEAAKASGVSQATLWRWLQRDDFQKEYRAAQNRVFDGAIGSLQASTTQAVECLRRNLNCESPAVQVQAARAILDYTIKARNLVDFETRIAELEQALRAREQAEEGWREE
jgi:hypothetical protein